MNQRTFHTLGVFLLFLAVFYALPFGVEAVENGPDVVVFFWATFLLIFMGGLLVLLPKPKQSPPLTLQESLFMGMLIWVSAILVGMFPLVFGESHCSPADALFQSTSLITTTGANLLPNIEGLSRGMILWCAFMQWIGGKSMLMFAILLIPQMGVDSYHLLHTESAQSSEKVTPRFLHHLLMIMSIYSILTVLCAAGYYVFGLSPFEAFIHGLTTISTGGFSLWNDSFHHASTPGILYFASFFMLLGATSFYLMLALLYVGMRALRQDDQFMSYIKAYLFFILGMLMIVFLQPLDKLNALQIAQHIFNTTSLFTTTGFAASDFSLWPAALLLGAMVMPLMGGCSGSTAGGIKIMRFQILWRMVRCHFRKMHYPHGVFAVKYNGKPVAEATVQAIISFVILFLLTLMGSTFILSLMHNSLFEAFSYALSCLTNLGPTFSAEVGVYGSYGILSTTSKIYLSLLMLLGRVEILPLILLCINYISSRKKGV